LLELELAAIEQAGYTDNVIELLLEKIRRLPPLTRHLLQLAASVGNQVALRTLEVVVERSPWQVQQDLWPALDAGLIQPLDERYKYLGAGDADPGVRYRFLHDRVQQAAYLIADPGERAAGHLRIGRLLLAHATAQQQDEQLFAIVEQLNAGRALITSAPERLRLAELNWRAGARARRSAAFQATLGHMQAGLELLPDDAWQRHPGLWLDLQLGAAEAAYLCGQFDAAEAIYPLVRARCATALLQVRCIAIQAHHYQLQGRLSDAIGVLRDGLALLGTDVPHEPARLDALADELFADIAQRRDGLAPETLLAAPRC
jgi:predicted ATPase